MKKQILKLIVVLSLIFTMVAPAHAYTQIPTDITRFEFCHNRYAELLDYQRKDIDKLLTGYRNGNITKDNLIYKLIDQADSEFYYDGTGGVVIECYNNDNYVYSIYYLNDGLVRIEFYDATINGKSITKMSVKDIMNYFEKKCKDKNLKYEKVIDSEEPLGEDAILYTSYILQGTKWCVGTQSSEKSNNTPKCVSLSII